jgi:hypothetical protein
MFAIRNFYSRASDWYEDNVAANTRKKISIVSKLASTSTCLWASVKFDSLKRFGAYIHEEGHAMALQLLYKNSYPKIYLDTFGNGICEFGFPRVWKFLPFTEVPVLSVIGKIIGRNTAETIVAAAGPALEITALTIVILRYPKYAAPLLLTNTVMVALYALSALVLDSNCHYTGHDYCNIWKSGGPIAYTAAAVTAFVPFCQAIKKIKKIFSEGDP